LPLLDKPRTAPSLLCPRFNIFPSSTNLTPFDRVNPNYFVSRIVLPQTGAPQGSKQGLRLVTEKLFSSFLGKYSALLQLTSPSLSLSNTAQPRTFGQMHTECVVHLNQSFLASWSIVRYGDLYTPPRFLLFPTCGARTDGKAFSTAFRFSMLHALNL
jgi:hypothetical protein